MVKGGSSDHMVQANSLSKHPAGGVLWACTSSIDEEVGFPIAILSYEWAGLPYMSGVVPSR
jgi:hypothetical protein